MEHLKHIYEEFQDIDAGVNLTNIFSNIPDDPQDPDYLKIKEIAMNGNLYKYLTSGQRKLTFGMLKSLHQDALLSLIHI